MRGATDDRPADGAAPASAPGPSGNPLLWIVAGVFAVVLAAWIIVFLIAHRHPVAPVPLTTRRGPG